MDLKNMSAVEIGSLIKNRKISSVEVVNELYKNITNNNNAYITLTKDYALKRAYYIQSLIDKKVELSSLAGVPISIKDNIYTKGIATTAGSSMLNGYIPSYSATAFQKLEDAGLIMVGKLNMDEFAMGATGETSFFGGCKNPFGSNKSTGGSSSGSASAIAFNEAIITLGSDTGGSIRQPASFCGVTGFKPSFGTISKYGLIGFAFDFDQIGPIGKTVLDCAKISEIMAGKDENDLSTINADKIKFFNKDFNIKNLKIGVVKNFIEESDTEIQKEILKSVVFFENMGAKIEYFNLDILNISMPTYQVLSCKMAAENMKNYGNFSSKDDFINSRSENFGKEVKKRISFGFFVLENEKYINEAIKNKLYIQKSFEQAFDKYDIILSPTTPKVAFDKDSPLETDTFLVGTNLYGGCGISVPCGFTNSNMPIGLHLMADNFKDFNIIELGNLYQKEFYRRF